jgi:PilZ domain-containing protein
VSRIWQALKEAERERKRAKSSGTARSIEEPDSGSPQEEAAAEQAAERRKDLRHAHEVTLLIYGSNSDRQPFHEESETIDANENGCLLTLENVVARGQRLFLTNTRNQAEQECRVVYIGKRFTGKARVGVEFLKPSPQFWRRA